MRRIFATLLLSFLCCAPGARGQAPAGNASAAAAGSPVSERVNELSRTAVRLYGEKKYGEAVSAAKSALELAEKELGREHRFVGRMLSNLALIHIAGDDRGKAVKLLERVFAIRAKAGGPSLDYERAAVNHYLCALLPQVRGRSAGFKDFRDTFDHMNLIFREDAAAGLGLTPPPAKDEISGGEQLVNAAPVYPEAAKRERLSGASFVFAEVDEAGRVAKTASLVCAERAPERVFAAASEDAARRSAFKPLLVRGKPVRFSAVLPYNYYISP
ncbi:MAG TPA: energy transducer TonB [Pyrinomonadaceae bacterium]|nr:energy transducer TonB [Pyrinomonadaceae bacterium]